MKGKSKSEEHRNKLAESNVSRNTSEEHKKKVSDSMKGRKVYANPETKEIVRRHEHPGDGWYAWSNSCGFVDRELRAKFPKESFKKN